MKTRLFLVLLLVASELLHAQQTQRDWANWYYSAAEREETDLQAVILEDWYKADSTDAEYYVAHFNFFVQQARQELLMLNETAPEGEALELQQNDSVKGYLSSQLYYDEALVRQGIDVLSKGISLHPKRLDMHFGRIYMLGQISDWTPFTEYILNTLKLGSEIGYQWTWSNHQPLEDGAGFMRDAIQDYIVQLYNTEADSLLSNIRRIAESVLASNPEHVESLVNLALVDIMESRYRDALKKLQLAEALSPQDPIVLVNTAQTYERQGDSRRAILYYKKLKAVDPEEYGAYADSKTSALKKKK
ncbi:MAG: tetratricopeptide repeat protein [Bacteroidia bacterium]|jgi:tetratricopeptide (TPR) repeat protein